MEPRAVEPRAVRGKTSPSRTSHAPGSVAEELCLTFKLELSTKPYPESPL